MRITSPCNTSSYIFMFIKCSKRNIWPSHIPNIDATIHYQGTAGNVVFPLRPPFDVSYRCYGVNRILQRWLDCQVPHLERTSVWRFQPAVDAYFQMCSLLFCMLDWMSLQISHFTQTMFFHNFIKIFTTMKSLSCKSSRF